MPLPQVRHLAALGSSFAAGPGIPPLANRQAGRSTRNYPNLLAERLGARLTDLTVSGATTATILHTPQQVWRTTFPPQLSLLPADVDLVTVTAGGNDLEYIGTMMRLATAARLGDHAVTRRLGRRMMQTPVPEPDERRISAAAAGLSDIVQGIRERAPHARVLLVSYLTVLEPAAPGSPQAPFDASTRDALLRIGAAVDQAFTHAAAATGADLVDAARLSRGHGLGSPDPWIEGFSLRRLSHSFHPTLAGMQAVANAIAVHLAASGPACDPA